jgi:hypothetical protein
MRGWRRKEMGGGGCACMVTTGSRQATMNIGVNGCWLLTFEKGCTRD